MRPSLVLLLASVSLAGATNFQSSLRASDDAAVYIASSASSPSRGISSSSVVAASSLAEIGIDKRASGRNAS
jgi:hypothetical protein